jgi:hypothetical protein
MTFAHDPQMVFWPFSTANRSVTIGVSGSAGPIVSHLLSIVNALKEKQVAFRSLT